MNDILSSIGVGINQIAIGHPMDTCLTLIQNKKQWKNLKIKDYYRGYKYPLCSSIIFNCTVFPIYNRTIDYTKSGALSGLIGGICVSPMVFLSDVGKVRRQTKQEIKPRDFLYSKGKLAIFTRECVAMTSYIGSYDYCKQQGLHPLLGGAIAGLTNWTLTYPIDVVKSRQIAQNISIKHAIKMGNLWKGYPICAFRAIIVNATNFYVYESLMKYLN
jgi:hypothetical protein